MEILEAIDSKCDDFLRTKVHRAVDRVKRTIELYGPSGVAFSFNGGKDSTVLLHIIRAATMQLQQEQHTAIAASSGAQGGLGGVHTFFFSRADDFPEIDAFVRDCDAAYGLGMRVFTGDFKSGLEAFIADTRCQAIFLGTRRGDPNAGGQEVWCPSSAGWPPFMRVNPILDWAYPDVWAFLRAVGAGYCSLYDAGYTSLGNTRNTQPNSALLREDGSFLPAHRLGDSRLERAGRGAAAVSACAPDAPNLRCGSVAIAIIGDEILSGKVADSNGTFLCAALHALGWRVGRLLVLPDDVPTISAELRRLAGSHDVVVTAGGVGPTPDDVTMAAVADALRVPLVRHPHLEASISAYMGERVTEAHLKMADAPEGACELVSYVLDDGRPSPFPLTVCRNIYVLPGVPHLLQQKWKAVRDHLQARSGQVSPFRSAALRLAAPDEAALSPALEGLEEAYGSRMAIGSYPVSDQEDGASLVLSLECKDEALLRKALAQLRAALPDGCGVVAEEWDPRAISRAASGQQLSSVASGQPDA